MKVIQINCINEVQFIVNVKKDVHFNLFI